MSGDAAVAAVSAAHVVVTWPDGRQRCMPVGEYVRLSCDVLGDSRARLVEPTEAARRLAEQQLADN